MRVDEIISQTECAYGLARGKLRSRSRTKTIAEARAVAAFLAYERTDESYAEVGSALRRAKQTVAELVDNVAARLAVRDRQWSAAVERVERLLGAG